MKISDRYHNLTTKTKVVLWLLASLVALCVITAGSYLIITNAPRFSDDKKSADSPISSTASDLFSEGEKLEKENQPEQALDKYKAARKAYEKTNDENGVASSVLKIQIAESMIATNKEAKTLSESNNPGVIVEQQDSN